MRPHILLCVSQQPNDIPYQFKVTGLHVYSFEEVLYHVYYWWKQSVDDYLSDELIAWVNDTLSLSFLAARMKEIKRIEIFSRRMLAFLRLVDYFDEAELDSLRADMEQWEKRLEWEKLKERADYLVTRGEPDKALVLYRRALQYGENTALLNNAGVAYMQLEAYAEAYNRLSRAIALEPDNTELTLHFAEAAIYRQSFDDACAALEKAAILSPGHRDIPFLYGIMYYEQGDYPQSIWYLEEAIALRETPEPHFVYRLADVYMRMRKYEKALEVLERIADKDVDFYVKQAELYAGSHNIPAAIKSMKQALLQQGGDADLRVKLAMYHRLDYDLTSAGTEITRALAIDPENEHARLENARIKKGLGRIREYQALLNNVLHGFKQKYRELC